MTIEGEPAKWTLYWHGVGNLLFGSFEASVIMNQHPHGRIVRGLVLPSVQVERTHSILYILMTFAAHEIL